MLLAQTGLLLAYNMSLIIFIINTTTNTVTTTTNNNITNKKTITTTIINTRPSTPSPRSSESQATPDSISIQSIGGLAMRPGGLLSVTEDVISQVTSLVEYYLILESPSGRY